MATPAHTMETGLYPKRYFNYHDDREAMEVEEELVAKLAADQMWEDPEFPAKASSLYLDPHCPPRGGLPGDAFEWLRVNSMEIMGMDHPKTFKYEVGLTKGQVVQGALGDRWLMSALALVGTSPANLKKLFVSEKYKEKGIYTIKLYKNGQWRYVHVDDRIPCNKAGKPYFASSRDLNETWVMLLEKAYAKVHGCYEALQGGFLEDALRDLTDNAVVKIETEHTKFSTNVANEMNLFQRMEKFLAEGAILGCSLEKPPKVHGGSKQPSDTGNNADNAPEKGEDKSVITGLMAGHGYGILEAKRFYAEPTEAMDGQHVYLLKLRNPWGEGTYKGKWSKYDTAMWDTYPKFKAQFFPKPARGALPDTDPNDVMSENSNVFYITFQDFVEHFNTLYVCYPKGDNGTSFMFRGKWVPGDPRSDAAGCPLHRSFSQNPQYTFQCLNPTTTAYITLSQYDHRWQVPQPPLKKYEALIGFFVVRMKESKRRLGKFHTRKVEGSTPYFSSTKLVSTTVVLTPGRYAIIPCTYLPAHETEKFLLQVVFDGQAENEQLDGQPADADDKVSDDEGLEDERLTDSTFPYVNADLPFEDMDKRLYQALQYQVADLSKYILSLRKSITALEATIGSKNLCQPSS